MARQKKRVLEGFYYGSIRVLEGFYYGSFRVLEGTKVRAGFDEGFS